MVSAIVLAAACLVSPVQSADLKDLLQAGSQYQFGESRKTWIQIEKACLRADRSPETRTEMAAQLAGFLGTEATLDAKRHACRLLAIYGSDKEIPALVQAMKIKGLRDVALYALEQNPSPRAKRTILGVRDAAEDSWQDRNDEKTLIKAEKLLEQGSLSQAQTLYQGLLKANSPPHVMDASLRGLAQIPGTKIMDILMDFLEGSDPRLQQVAARAIETVEGPEVIGAVASLIGKGNSKRRITLLGVLENQDHVESQRIVLPLLGDESEEVRIKAIEVLAEVGNEKGLAGLMKRLSTGTTGEKDAAVETLGRLKGQGISATLTSSLSSMGSLDKVLVLEILAQRGESIDLNPLFVPLQHLDRKVRKAAWKTLGILGQDKDLTQMAKELLRMTHSSDKKAAVRALFATAGRSDDTENAALKIITVMKKGSGPRMALLIQTLGKIGGSRAALAVEKMLANPNPELSKEALRAMSNWPDSTFRQRLKDITGKETDEGHKIIAFRGYLRAVDLWDGSPEEKLREYQSADNLAKRPEEKKLILAGLSKLPLPGAMDFAFEMMKRPGLESEGASAVISISESTIITNPAVSRKGLDTVLGLSLIPEIKSRATGVMEALDSTTGYVVHWEVSGPFQKFKIAGWDLSPIPFWPEINSKTNSWAAGEAIRTEDGAMALDMFALWDKIHAVGYARCVLMADQRGKAVLKLGSDDGIKVWHNNKLIHKNSVVSRGLVPNQDQVKVRLKKGRNEFLFKVSQGTGGWGLCARFVSQKGKPLTGIEFVSTK